MRIGGMHLAMSFISAIGKLYSDGGLLSLLVDSDTYALLTAQEMLRGKQYSRAVRGIMLVVEALYRVFLNTAGAWMATQNRTLISEHINTVLQKIDKGFQSRELNDIVSNIDELADNTKEVAKELQEFAVVGRDASLTFKYWHDLLEGGLILLRLIRADRDNNFALHLDAVRQTVSWFVAAGKINYAKWTPIYIAEMLQLESSHPESFQHMREGAFVVRRSSNTFNCVPTDQALEQSVNRECKSRGGIVGFTMRKGARLRWILTRHVSGMYASAVKSLFDSKPTSRQHEELSSRRIARDEHGVSKMVKLLEDDWKNPFDLNTVPKNLTNIATGLVASSKIEGSLSRCLDNASQLAETFVKTRLTTCPRIVSFWDKVPQTKTYTFADMKKTISSSGQEIIIDTEVLFRRLLAVAKNREVSLVDVLSHELAALPPSLFNADGTMRKTSKADLARVMESHCPEVHQLPTLPRHSKSALIIDGMALLCTLNENSFTTFDELGHLVIRRLTVMVQKDKTVKALVLVFDRYDHSKSVKGMERRRRSRFQEGRAHIVLGSRAVPNFRQFLTNSENKSSLANFVSEYIIENATGNFQDVQIILSGGFTQAKRVVSIDHDGTKEVHALFANHEEADTRMVYHAVAMARSFDRIVIRCDDTDVLVLLVYYCSRGMLGKSIYMNTGHVTKNIDRYRYIPVHDIASSLGAGVCAFLPVAHSLTGCDTTRSFFRIGKKTAFSILIKDVDSLANLENFGNGNDISADRDVARKYVMKFYNRKGKKENTNFDELRHNIATTSDKPAAALPPTEDAFLQHVKRARYQAHIWCFSHRPEPCMIDPLESGWREVEGCIEPIPYEKDPAPKEVRDITHMFCVHKKCTLNAKCKCYAVGLRCIDICGCGAECLNSKREETFLSDSEDEFDN